MKERIERYKLKIRKKLNPLFAKSRRLKLNNNDFTIISNNCWGGVVYQYFNLPYLSPTVGMYFFAEDYIKFIYRLKYYLDQPLVVVTYQESKYKDILIKKGQTHCLVGKLDDVEIVLLHYQDKDDAIEKWNRRVRRVNYDNLIFKMSEMNCCNIRHLCMFDDFSTKKKVLFTSRSYDLQSEIVCNEWAKIGEIKNDTTNFKKHINLVRLING